jgi:hypothetical protein
MHRPIPTPTIAPAEIIRHAVWLYFRFGVSVLDIEELLAAHKEVLPDVYTTMVDGKTIGLRFTIRLLGNGNTRC